MKKELQTPIWSYHLMVLFFKLLITSVLILKKNGLFIIW